MDTDRAAFMLARAEQMRQQASRSIDFGIRDELRLARAWEVLATHLSARAQTSEPVEFRSS